MKEITVDHAAHTHTQTHTLYIYLMTTDIPLLRPRWLAGEIETYISLNFS
jgi:hypothetical protein